MMLEKNYQTITGLIVDHTRDRGSDEEISLYYGMDVKTNLDI